jgi:hypothetical protein
MAALSTFSEIEPVKMLIVGNSGSGKTGSLLALARRGFKLRIADFDNGAAGTLLPLMEPKEKSGPAALDIDIEVFTDQFKQMPVFLEKGKPPQRVMQVVNNPDCWERFGAIFDAWPGKGSIMSWKPDTIFVWDSLSFAAQAALRHILRINNRNGLQPYQSDWGDAMREVEAMLATLYNPLIKCHVVVNSHILYVGEEETPGASRREGYPMTIGNKLSPRVPRYFNTMIRTRSERTGSQTHRKILTQGDVGIELKVPAKGVPPILPQETGLADIFTALGWKTPPKAAEPAASAA